MTRTTNSGRGFTDAEYLSIAEAVRACTVGSAHAVHEETIKGRLTHGQLADFVVLSQDLCDIPAEAIADTEVSATVVGGRLAYGSF